jgi:hypothetical protein
MAFLSDDWVYWHFFQSIMTALKLNSFSMTSVWRRLYEETLTQLSWTEITYLRTECRLNCLLLFCLFSRECFVNTVFVAAETAAMKSLPSKTISASAALLALRQCLPSRCLANGHIPSQYKRVALTVIHPLLSPVIKPSPWKYPQSVLSILRIETATREEDKEW